MLFKMHNAVPPAANSYFYIPGGPKKTSERLLACQCWSKIYFQI